MKFQYHVLLEKRCLMRCMLNLPLLVASMGGDERIVWLYQLAGLTVHLKFWSLQRNLEFDLSTCLMPTSL